MLVIDTVLVGVHRFKTLSKYFVHNQANYRLVGVRVRSLFFFTFLWFLTFNVGKFVYLMFCVSFFLYFFLWLWFCFVCFPFGLLAYNSEFSGLFCFLGVWFVNNIRFGKLNGQDVVDTRPVPYIGKHV